jgi:hypothetical protein
VRRLLSLAALGAGCGEATIVPSEPIPLYGAIEPLPQCAGNLQEGGTRTITVVNEWTGEVAVNAVDPTTCEELPYATVPPGEALDVESPTGLVYVVRDPVTLYLFAHFLVTADAPAEVVVP